MKFNSLLSKSGIFKILVCLCGLLPLACDQLQPDNSDDETQRNLLAGLAFATPQTYSIEFAALDASNARFACGTAFSAASTAGGTASFRPVDLRFYISEIKLINALGGDVSVTIPNVTNNQAYNAALLDFENATGDCTGGTSDTNTRLVIQTPPGIFSGIAFTLGLPYSLNRLNNSTETAPFNVPAMYWSWTAGYKFVKFEYMNPGNTNKMNLHIGSSGCSGGINNQDCTQPFRREIRVTSPQGFVPGRDLVALDLSALLNGAESSLGANRICMPSQGGTICDPLLTSVGLDRTTGQATTSSPTAFRIVKQ